MKDIIGISFIMVGLICLAVALLLNAPRCTPTSDGIYIGNMLVGGCATTRGRR